MSKGIRLSEKHGVNPSVGVCFWCGRDNGTVVLPGLLPDDAEAPRRAVWDWEPCDVCIEDRSQGITFEEHTEDRAPTGRWVVVKEEAVPGIINDTFLLASVLEQRVVHTDPEAFEMVFGHTFE